MLPAFLADADNSSIGTIMQSLSVLLLLALTVMQLVKGASGKDGQRQIEPTEMHAITTELRAQTVTLNKLDREMGVVSKSVESMEEQMSGMHHRVGSISRDLSATSARVDGLEKREKHNRA